MYFSGKAVTRETRKKDDCRRTATRMDDSGELAESTSINRKMHVFGKELPDEGEKQPFKRKCCAFRSCGP